MTVAELIEALQRLPMSAMSATVEIAIAVNPDLDVQLMADDEGSLSTVAREVVYEHGVVEINDGDL